MVVRHSQLHQSRLVEHLQSLNPAYTDFTTQLGHAAHVAPGSPPVTAGIFQIAVQQATMLSYLDAFKAVAVVVLLLLPLLFLVRPGAASKEGAAVG